MATEEEQGKERTAFPDAALPTAASSSVAGTTPVASQPSPSSSSSSRPSPQDSAGLDSVDDHADWISPGNTQPKPRQSPLLAGITMVLGLLLVLGLGGGMAYFWIPGVSDRINAALGINSDTTDLGDSQNPSSSQDLIEPNDHHSAESLPTVPTSVPTSGGVRDMDEVLTIGHVLNLRRTAPVPRTIDVPEIENPANPEGENTLLLLFARPPELDVVPSAPQVEPALYW